LRKSLKWWRKVVLTGKEYLNLGINAYRITARYGRSR
jgi:hypothetical protein